MTADPPTITLRIRYFAALREQAGCAEETLATQAGTPAALFSDLVRRHKLTLDPAFLRVSVNDRYADMQCQLHDGDQVAFIPPVSGG